MSKFYIEIVANGQSDLSSDQKTHFNLTANQISSYFNLHVEKLKVIKGLKKIRIDLTTQKDSFHIVPFFPGNPVCSITDYYNFDRFFSKTNIVEKQYEVLQQMKDNVNKVCEKFNIDKQIFEEALSLTLNKLANDLIVDKSFDIVGSTNNKTKASIRVLLEKDSLIVTCEFRNADEKLIKEIEVIKLLPNFYFLKLILGDVQWLNDHEIIIKNNTNEISLIISLTTETVKVHYNPIESSEDMLQSFINKVSFKNTISFD